MYVPYEFTGHGGWGSSWTSWCWCTFETLIQTLSPVEQNWLIFDFRWSMFAVNQDNYFSLPSIQSRRGHLVPVFEIATWTTTSYVIIGHKSNLDSSGSWSSAKAHRPLVYFALTKRGAVYIIIEYIVKFNIDDSILCIYCEWTAVSRYFFLAADADHRSCDVKDNDNCKVSFAYAYDLTHVNVQLTKGMNILG